MKEKETMKVYYCSNFIITYVYRIIKSKQKQRYLRVVNFKVDSMGKKVTMERQNTKFNVELVVERQLCCYCGLAFLKATMNFRSGSYASRTFLNSSGYSFSKRLMILTAPSRCLVEHLVQLVLKASGK